MAALAVLLVLFLAVKGCASCSASERDGADGAAASAGAASSTQNDDGQEGDAGSADSASEDEPVYAGAPLRQSVATGGLVATYLAPIDYDSLSYLVGDAFAAQLVAVSAYDMDVRWIISNIDAYAMDGEAVQAKLLKLAAKEPEAVDFVRRFPASYPMEQGEPCTETAGGDRPPLLYQWDRKWGYTVYSSTAFALTGCCPTSLAMVYQGLTGKTDLSPYDMGVIAQRDGYMTEYNGTDARYLVNEAPSLGLTCNEVPADADEITAALSNGALVIANMAPGDFTEGGHFIVLASLDDSGNVVVNDPYSAVRSAKTWSPNLIADQAISLYVYYAA